MKETPRYSAQVKTMARLGYLIEAAAALAREGRRVVIQAPDQDDRRQLRKLVNTLCPALKTKIRVSSLHGQALMAQQVAEARKVKGRTWPKRPKNPRKHPLGTKPQATVGRAELLRLLAGAPRPVDDYDLELTEDLWWRKEIEFTDAGAGPIKMILTAQGHRAIRQSQIAPPPDAS